MDRRKGERVLFKIPMTPIFKVPNFGNAWAGEGPGRVCYSHIDVGIGVRSFGNAWTGEGPGRVLFGSGIVKKIDHVALGWLYGL